MESKNVVLRGAQRQQSRKAQRAAKKAAKNATKGTKQHASRGINGVSSFNVQSITDALTGDATQYLTTQLEAQENSHADVLNALQAAIADGAEVDVIIGHSVAIKKLSSDIARTKAQIKDKTPSDEALDMLDRIATRQLRALLTSFVYFVLPTAEETKAAKLGVVSDEAERAIVRAAMVEMLRKCKGMFPKVAQG